MYYRLDSDLAEQNVYLEAQSDDFISVISGAPLPADTPVPFRYVMEVDSDEEGEPMQPVMFSYFPGDSLMHKKLIDTLQKAGVDNLQTFPAIIENSETGEENRDYAVANVIGLVSCADLDQSESEPLADVHYFHKLIIDPKRTHGLLLFRLAESQMEIIVEEKVAAAIRAGNFQGVVLEPLDETA